MIISGDAKLVASAFVKARGEMSATVAKDKKGNFGDYATLAALVEATAAAFSAHGLAIVQEAELDENGVTIATWLVHESGSTIEFTPLTMPLTNRTSQAVGSAITYARRYQLASVCGFAPDDDDGQAATDAQKSNGKPVQNAQKAQSVAQAQSKRNDTAKAQTTPQPVSVVPVGVVNPFEGPSDDELEVLGTWHNPQEAQAWAVETGACKNEHHARESFKKIVDANGGKLTKDNIGTVYLAFLRHQNEKQEAAQTEQDKVSA